MEDEYLTHKEIQFALKEVNNKIENLNNKLSQFKREYLAHRDGDNISLE